MGKQSRLAPRAPVDLEALAVFVRVVEARSFSGAARRIATTTSAVSKRVARLEAQLGARLLERTTRRVALTEAGAEFYERCIAIVAAVDDAAEAVALHTGAARGTLRVSAPVIFGERYLAPLLPAFMALHPALRVDLALSDRYVDLVAEGFDVAVRVGALPDSSLVARRLGRAPMVVCAAPAYLARRGTPRAPADLATHECLRYSLVRATHEWRFRGADGEFSVPVVGKLQIDHGGAMREAAIAGAGLAQLPRFVVADALLSGALREVLAEHRSTDRGVFAVHLAGRLALRKVEVFLGFLAETLPPRLR